MNGRIECEPGCTCRGTDGLIEPGTPCYDQAILLALDLASVVNRQMEVAASKLRHPSSGNRNLPDWMRGQVT